MRRKSLPHPLNFLGFGLIDVILFRKIFESSCFLNSLQVFCRISWYSNSVHTASGLSSLSFIFNIRNRFYNDKDYRPDGVCLLLLLLSVRKRRAIGLLHIFKKKSLTHKIFAQEEKSCLTQKAFNLKKLSKKNRIRMRNHRIAREQNRICPIPFGSLNETKVLLFLIWILIWIFRDFTSYQE